MEKLKFLPKTILSVAAISAIVIMSFASTNLYAGCVVVPGQKKGWCSENVEGGYSCIASFFKDCTSSGPSTPQQ